MESSAGSRAASPRRRVRRARGGHGDSQSINTPCEDEDEYSDQDEEGGSDYDDDDSLFLLRP